MRITEPMMFRVVVVVGFAMIPVILLAAVVAPIAGAILLGVEACAAIGFLVHRVQASRASRADAASKPDDDAVSQSKTLTP